MSTTQIILLALGAVLLFWVVGAYNRMVRMRTRSATPSRRSMCNSSAVMTDPNLVEVARKYLEHERETLERVTAARAQVMAATDMVKSHPNQSGPIKSLGLAEGGAGQRPGRFQAVVEAYPELKADQQMADLREELIHTENKVSFSRQLFNDVTLDYNNAIHQFPTNLLAGLFSFQTAEMLQSTSSEAERAPVKVSF